jgi:hypothetical protein
MPAKWSLNPEEVASSLSSSASTKGRQFNRRLQTRSCTLTLSHPTTGLQVTGEIPSGHYSKKEMKQLRDDLYRKLFPLLEAKVAKHLRVPGRS